MMSLIILSSSTVFSTLLLSHSLLFDSFYIIFFLKHTSCLENNSFSLFLFVQWKRIIKEWLLYLLKYMCSCKCFLYWSTKNMYIFEVFVGLYKIVLTKETGVAPVLQNSILRNYGWSEFSVIAEKIYELSLKKAQNLERNSIGANTCFRFVYWVCLFTNCVDK